jgi:lipoate---protein ligase
VHGEYKVAGGKLVRVDLQIRDGLLSDVRVSGDFFLEPDHALEAIDAGLLGVPVGASADELAAAVRRALPAGAVLVGFSPEAVAKAVRRALTRATEWHDYDWELVHVEPQEPLLHMALDQVLTEEVASGRRKPTLRIWEWAAPAVVIGSFQSVRNEVDLEAADRFGIQVVRRVSGGGAMFIEPGNTITYSISAPDALVQGLSYAESYPFFDDWVLGALQSLGIDAWYQPLNDITSSGGKIGGAAQKRLATGATLHHVTMAYDIDAAKMLDVLRIGREKLSDKGHASAAKRVDPLRRQTGLRREAVIDRMVDTFRSRYGLTMGSLGDHELARAKELVDTKFGTEKWLHRIP